MKLPKSYILLGTGFLSFFIFLFMLGGPAYSREVDCIGCHETLSSGKVVHQALSMGCPTCHSAIDANKIPHKTTNNRAKGLSSKALDLCYDCHDKAQFMKKTTHAALVLGCSSCHNPHSSMDSKLLVSSMPGLCFTCHEKDSVTGKNSAHPQVAGVLCTSCHNPHSTDTPQLLSFQPSAPPLL